MSVYPAAAPPVRRKTLLVRILKHKFLYLLILPPILYYIIFHYIPMFGIIIAFKEIRPADGIPGIFSSPWVGLQHFENFFNTFYFKRVVLNTINFSLRNLIFGFPAPIILALAFNEIRNRYFLRIFQTISYLPHFLSAVIICSMLTTLLSLDGPLNALVGMLGAEAQMYLQNAKYFVGIVVASQIWATVGWNSIIYFAAISNVPVEMYDSADIDGASKLQKIWYITLPSIANVMAILLILNTGSILSSNFDFIFNLASPTVMDVADVLDFYIYREGVMNASVSYSTAIGFAKSAISLGILLSTNKIVKTLGFEGIW